MHADWEKCTTIEELETKLSGNCELAVGSGITQDIKDVIKRACQIDNAALRQQLEAAEKDAQKWKQMAEFQYAVRQYPHDLNLGQGALDAYFKGWSFDAAIAAGRKS